MRNTFKYSTSVLKLALSSLILSSVFMMPINASTKSENYKMVREQVRIGLWYGGVEQLQVDKKVSAQSNRPEELKRALEKLKAEKKQ